MSDATLPRPRGSARAWLGVLTGPIAWAVQLIGSWTLGEVIACAPGNRHVGSILGLRVNALAAIVSAVLLGATLAAGIAALTELRARRAEVDPTPAGRATWLATAGVMTSALFAILIAASFVPIGIVGGC